MRLIRLLPLLLFRFRTHVRVVWGMLRSPATPLAAKVAAILALVYLISPIDLLPDALPVLGWMDDAALVTVLLTVAVKLLPAELYDALRGKAGVNKA
jgi:uncharacterized membrane protein YkvA (DUF1232 family)